MTSSESRQHETADEVTVVLDRSRPEPLWQQVERVLRDEIASGLHSERFPTEKELSDRFSISRHTIRQALARLTDEGFLDRRRGRGTVVVSDRFEQPLGSLYSLFESVEGRGIEQRSTVLALESVEDASAAVALGCEPGTELILLSRVRHAGDEPLALDRVWLPAADAHPLLAVDFTRTSLYGELRDRCAISIDGGRERIDPVVLDDREAALLQVTERPAAALRVERLGTVGERVVEFRVTVLRGDRAGFTVSWNRHGADLGELKMVDQGQL